MGCPPPTWSAPPGTAPLPSFSQSLEWAGPPWLPAFWWLQPYLFYSHIFDHQPVISIENKGMEYIAKKEQQ